MTTPGGRADGYILVVDDDEDIRLTMQQILQEEGFQALAAANGDEAMRMIQSRAPGLRPCLILLDLMMPVMDGPRFFTLLNEDPSLAEVPVVIISAGAGLAGRATSLKAAGYLTKPIDLRTLMRTVRRFTDAPSPAA